jgi:hypothetical protein
MSDPIELARLREKLRDLEDLRDSGLLIQQKDGRRLQFQSGEHLRAAIADLKRDIERASGNRRRRTIRIYEKGTGLT